MSIFVCGLLFYANAIAFDLFIVPEFVNSIILYVAIAVAVALTITIIAIAIREIRLGVSPKTQKPQTPATTKEPEETPKIAPTQANVQESIKPQPQLQTLKTQKTADGVEIKLPGPQQFKPPTKDYTTLICPACRKEFNVSIYQGVVMVDFAPPRTPKLIRSCPHCNADIPVKQKGLISEDIWRD